MRHLIRFIRIYTPFICTIMALLNGVLFMKGANNWMNNPFAYIMFLTDGG